ncbi:MAG: exo-alpha-sialidase [Candidatus Hydrogenedentes bacterium]|nr:exo-alpha-sialidase [Candidatus Hydrogenedentota bacterium]
MRRIAVLALLCTAAGVSAAQGLVQAGGFAVLDLPPGPGNPRNSEGDILQLNDGRLMYVYTHFTGSSSDHGAAHLAARYSSDGGETWTTEDKVIVENEGGMNVMSVSLLRLASGEIVLLYLRKNSTSDCRPLLRFSTDEAATWSEPVEAIDDIGYFVVNNDRLVQLKSGRLVIPTARHTLPGGDFRGRGQATCYLSDDNGRTWRVSDSLLEAPDDSESGLQEPCVVELKDGRLLMLCRTDQGCQMRSFSTNSGVTWSPVERTDIIAPVSPATIERIPSTGDLLLVWNDHRAISGELKGKRTPLTAAISSDDGDTWGAPIALEDSPTGWYCYIAMDFIGDNVFLGYCAGDTTREGGLDRTRIARIPISSLYPATTK